jgi:hypothetical protein
VTTGPSPKAPGRARGAPGAALVAWLGALVLVVAACGGSAASPSPTAATGASPSPDIRLLPGGLAANLDKLGSYKFAEDIYSGGGGGSPAPDQASSSASASAAASASGMTSPGGTRSLRVEGIVVNGAGGTGRSIELTMSGVRYVVVGDSAWSSADGALWASVDDLPDVLSLLPAAYYETWFDPRVSGFSAVGEEDHNGIACTRFSGSQALGNLYASAAGGSFQADLWIAQDGSYPVGGRYLVPVGGYVSGYSFEITAVDDPANAVAAPTYVVPLPS